MKACEILNKVVKERSSILISWDRRLSIKILLASKNWWLNNLLVVFHTWAKTKIMAGMKNNKTTKSILSN